jgi:hypothetical protein
MNHEMRQRIGYLPEDHGQTFSRLFARLGRHSSDASPATHRPFTRSPAGSSVEHPRLGAPWPPSGERRNSKRPHCGASVRAASIPPAGTWAASGTPSAHPVRPPPAPVQPGRHTPRETLPQHRAARRSASSSRAIGPCVRVAAPAGSAPHQPAAADPKLSPHPLDRPALRDAPCLQVGRQILEAQFYQPRHPTRLPAHRLHPTP